MSTGKPTIAFIQLGPLPEYLPVAMRQAQTFNPDARLVLITDQGDALQGPEVERISVSDLGDSVEHEQFRLQTNLDTEFREGFWRRTTERMFYLHRFALQEQVDNLFHIENDVMLYAELGALLTTFEGHYEGLAMPFDSDDRAVLSVVYSRTPDALGSLAAFIAEHAASGLNDMQLCALFRWTRGPRSLASFPTVPPEYAEMFPLRSPNGLVVEDSSFLTDLARPLGLIFDPAAIGQYLGGTDPRNGPSRPGFINESSVLNPCRLEHGWREDEEGRRAPYVGIEGRTYRLANLHIHNKELKHFRSAA